MAAADSTVEEFFSGSYFSCTNVNVLRVIKLFENAVIAFHLFIMFKRAAVNWMKAAHCIRIVVMTLFKMKSNPLFFGHRTISECDERLSKSSVKYINDLPAHGVHERRTRKIGELYIFTKSVELAAQEAEVQQRKLDAEVRKQADADLYRRQKEAEAKKYEAERAAEAQKFSKQQEAEGIELVGKAEAEAIRQKGLAEAEAMKQKAEAYKQYNDAAVAEMLIKVLPDIAKSVAQPLSSIDKVSIIGGDASGVSGVSGNVPILMAQTMQTVKEATGIDMGEIVRANSIQAKTDRNINIMTQCEQPENNKEKGGAKAMERVEGGYLIHEKSLNGEEVTHFRPDVTEEEKAIMKDKKAKD